MISEDKIVPYKVTELPVDNGPWLVFAPHADDESFGMGGTLVKAVESGIQVELVVMTDGALGGAQENLAEIRKEEATLAAASLLLEAPVFLDNNDRGLSFNERTVAQVVAEVRRVKPSAVFFPGPFELHPDHRMTTLIVWQALKNLVSQEITPVGYEVLVQSPVNTLVDITAFVERKKAAMSVYKSQLLENNYIEIALALNKLRKLTLSSEVSYAEGFYVFETDDLAMELVDVITSKIAGYLVDTNMPH